MDVPGAMKPTHKTVKAYYEALEAYASQGVTHEGATETAFQRLLGEGGRWKISAKNSTSSTPSTSDSSRDTPSRQPTRMASSTRHRKSRRFHVCQRGRSPAKEMRQKSVGQRGPILDPYTGIGNFIVNLVNRLQLFCHCPNRLRPTLPYQANSRVLLVPEFGMAPLAVCLETRQSPVCNDNTCLASAAR